MPGLTLTITDVGRAALVNAQNTGTDALVVSQVGVSAVHAAGGLAALAVLPNELKRLVTFGGAVVADDTLHLSIRDESGDAYSLRAFGLYLSDGTLFGVCSQAAVILEKSPSSMTLLATDIVLASLTTAQIQFGDTNFINPPATVDTPGVVQLASQVEVAAGVNSTKAVTPRWLKALLDGLLATLAPANHTHDASATVSGVFAVARIPDLAMAKITGLASALLAKVSAVDFTWANLGGKPNVWVQGTASTLPAFSGDNGFRAGNADANTFAGHNIVLKGWFGMGMADHTDVVRGVYDFRNGVWNVKGGYHIDGVSVWHPGNFNPADKANAIHSHDWVQVTGKPGTLSYTDGFETFTARKIAKSTADGGLQAQNYQATPFEVQAKDSDDAVGITFHIPGVKAEKLGIDNDGEWKVTYAGGARRLWHDQNFDPSSKAAAIHSHDWSQVTGKPSSLHVARASVGNTTDFNTLTTAGAYDVDQQGAWHANNPVGAYAYGQLIVSAGALYTVDQIYCAHSGEIWNRQSFNGAWGAWRRVWSSANAATAAEFRSGGGVGGLSAPAVWAAAQIVAAAQAETIAIDLAAGLNFSTTMTGNRTLGAPANAKPGQSGVIQLTQDGVGNRALAFEAAWKFAGGAEPALSTAANARDILVFTVIAPGDVAASLMKDVR